MALHSFARGTRHKNCFLVSWRFMSWQITTPKGVIRFIVSGTFIKRTILTPFQSRSVSGYIYLCLLGGKTLQFFTTLARHLHVRSLPLGTGVLGQRLSIFACPRHCRCSLYLLSPSHSSPAPPSPSLPPLHLSPDASRKLHVFRHDRHTLIWFKIS